MDSNFISDLVIKYQNGDEKALELLCENIGQLLRDYFKRKIKDDDAINDLCQETYLRLLQNLSNIREPVKLKNFVLKTSFHVIQDFFRKKSKIKNDHSSDPDLNESDSDQFKTNLNPDDKILTGIDITNAIRKLPERSQLIIRLYAEGFKYNEISELVGMSESAIKMQIKRNLKKIQFFL